MATKWNKIIKKRIKQVHNRYLGKKKDAKARAKSVGKKPSRGGFKKLKKWREGMIKAASKIRKECSNMNPGERRRYLDHALGLAG